jgi:hypothetical protein
MPRRKRRDPPADAGAPDTSGARDPAAAPAPREPAPRGATPLSPRDERIATAIATGRRQTEAAAYAGCGVRTVYDAVRRPDVAERIREIRLECLTEAVGQLTALHSEAVATVAAVMRDANVTPHTRVWAAQLVMERTIVMTEHMDLRRELAEMKAALSEIGGKRR